MLRVGLVGAGAISHAHLPHLIALGAEVTVFSRSGAEALAARYGARVAGTFDELLDAVEVVDIVTPTTTHLGFAARALEAGRHVILEKPVALSVADAEELGRIEAAGPARVLPAHVVRWFPAYAAARAEVAAGQLGRPVALRFSRGGAHPGRSWFADPERSGGIVTDLMIHDLDQARWIAGEVVAVSAVGARAGTAEHPVEAAHVTLTHASGAVSAASGVWGPPGMPFATAFSIVGEGGTVTRDSPTDPGTAGPDPYRAQLEELLAALRAGTAARVDLADGIAAVRLAAAARESIRSGAPVALS